MSQLFQNRRRHLSVDPTEAILLPEDQDLADLPEHSDGVSSLENARAAPDTEESCVNCHDKERVYRRGQLKIGDHIELPRPQIYAKAVGLWVYSHFAFVEKVERDPDHPEDETRVRLTLIEKQRSEPYIRRSVKTYNLKAYYMLVHRYRKPTFSAEESVRRANIALEEYKRHARGEMTGSNDSMFMYKLLENNCEHFVSWIKTGVLFCSQVKKVTDGGVGVFSTVLSKALAFINKIVRIIVTKVRGIIDDIGGASTISSIVSGLLMGLALLIAVAIAIYDLYSYHKLRKGKKLCKQCYTQKIVKILALLGASLALVGIGALASHFAGLALAIVVFFTGSALSWIISKCFDRIYKLFQSFFPSRNITKHLVDPTTINPGDAVRFRYYGLPHAGIVTSVSEDALTVAHYAFTSFAGRRQVREEWMPLHNHIWQVHDYTGVATYPCDVVVQRARGRVGETKFNTFTNRSSHFVAWCKVDRGADIRNQDSFSLLFDWQKVFVWDEVNCGDAVQVWMYGRRHSAILVSKRRQPINRKKVRIIHYGYRNTIFSERMVKSDELLMDLKVNYLYRRELAHYSCYEPNEVVARAKDCFRRNQKFPNSKEFIFYCKVK